jgi:hypothetical protein
VVAVYDPGDALDRTAGVSIYKDGVEVPHRSQAYRYRDYRIYPMNGRVPLRLGTRDLVSYFTGALDEVAVFDRKLSPAEIASLYGAAR